LLIKSEVPVVVSRKEAEKEIEKAAVINFTDGKI